MIKVYDCFMFNGEWDMINLRLHTHDPVVDFFVVVESNYTFSGVAKEFELNLEHPDLLPFLHKIRHVKVQDMPNNGNPWDNEFWQRNALTRGLWDANAEDLIIISDCDELIKPEIIQYAKNQLDHDWFGFVQPMYYCYMNNQCVGEHANRIWSVAVRYKRLSAHDAIWHRSHAGAYAQGYMWFWDAGWHYSYMMDREQILHKLESFSHQELNVPQLKESINPEQSVRNNQDLLGRPHVQWKLIPDSELCVPAYVTQNMQRYAKYFFTSK